jgi:hypothetical protein
LEEGNFGEILDRKNMKEMKGCRGIFDRINKINRIGRAENLVGMTEFNE